MTNVNHHAASELLQKPITDVQHALAAEVSQGREIVDVALRWLAENGISFLINVLVALLLLTVGTVAIRCPGETLRWDSPALAISGSAAAPGLLRRTYRDGWRVEGLG